MATTPNMRVMVTTVIDRDGHQTSHITKHPYSPSSNGGPPDVMQHRGVTQVIVIRDDPVGQIVSYNWLELKMIPDPEMAGD